MGRGKRQNKISPNLSLLQSQDWQGHGFVVTQREGLTLVAPPKAGKAAAKDWPKEDRPFRSTLLKEGKIVSLGLPKFFNYGEDPEDTSILERALEQGGKVIFSEKIDGSLIIRSVIDGEVIFRTRASFDGGDHGVAARACVKKTYPHLLDPTFVPNLSLLLEFVSPQFRIVLSYPKPDLFFVGAVENKTQRLLDWEELENLNQEANLNLTPAHELPRDPKALLEVVAAWQGKEGIVARVGQTFVKIKGADYLAKHRLRFSLTGRIIRETCLQLDVHEIKQFTDYLLQNGGDWELAKGARPFVEGFISARHEAEEHFLKLEAEVQGKLKEFPVRKEFALNYALKLPEYERPCAFALADSQRGRAYDQLESFYLDLAFAKATELDADIETLLAEDEG